MKYSKGEKRFQSVNLLAVVALFILILAGGVVRSTGSGMGCPDWPKCFGRYIPPVKEAQLPTGYRTQYIVRQQKKNQHFAKLLDAFGYVSLASKVRDNNFISSNQEEFNAAKTWTEYINRLITAVTGLILLLTAFWSFQYWKTSKAIVILSVFNLFLVAVQAWIGSVVVSSNLVPWIVTVHMLLALWILAITIYTLYRSKLNNPRKNFNLKPLVILIAVLALILDILQITLGTEVREKIDEYAGKLNSGLRNNWISGAETILNNHKNMALIVIIVNIILYILVRKNFIKSSVHQQLMSITFVLIMLQALVGAILSYWGLPPVAQVLHLSLASLLFGAQFYLLLNLFRSAESGKVMYGVE